MKIEQETRIRAAQRGFDTPKEWAKQNSKWETIHRKRDNRGLADALLSEWQEWGLHRFNQK